MSTTRSPSRAGSQAATPWVLFGLLGAMAVAVGVRSLLFRTIFLDDGFVLLGLDDSAYHARRALYSFANFPAVLLFDPYIAYPDGSPIPFPPLYDWTIAAGARLFGDTAAVFERVAAWTAVLLATATLLPVYGMGRALISPRAGVAAAWIFALLPASSLLSSLGYLDHHAAVAFVAACWLWSSLREITDEPARRALRVGVHGLIVAAMPLVWQGSLLYIGLAEGTRLLVGAVFWQRPARLLDQSSSALLAAALVAPWVAASPPPIDGAFSSTALSWLHVLVLLSLSVLAAMAGLLEQRRPEPRWPARGARMLGLALVVALPLLAIPGLAATLVTALTFVSGQDAWAASSPEQQPLFSATPEMLKRSATARFGWLAYGVPLLPLLVAVRLRDPERREAAALLLGWTTLLTLLTLAQVRFANDLAPLASVVFAGAGATLHQRLTRRLPAHAADGVCVALAVLLLWPALAQVHWPRARWALRSWAAGGEPETAPLSPWESEVRFALEVGRVTPETSGFLDARRAPEYGLLVDPSIGHSFLYWARRAVPANNFGEYLDREKFELATRFYGEVDAARAALALDRLGTRFVVTAAAPFSPPMPYGQRLHRGDGFRGGDPVCGPCLRLVTEGPPRGTPRRRMQTQRGFVPYKLWERVPGARVVIAAVPDTPVRLELDLATPLGRRFTFTLDARAGDDGRARLRVPYATEATAPVHAVGPYRVRIGDAAPRTLEVPEATVRAGDTLTLPPTKGAPAEALRTPAPASAGLRAS